MHPSCFVAVWLSEYGVCDGQVMHCAHSEEEKTIAVAFAYAVFAYDSIPGPMVSSHPCVEVTKNDELVLFWHSSSS